MPARHRPPAGPIVLTTDFGLEDGYAGVMKGVILGINPAATIVDLSHHVRPQDVPGAAFLLWTSYRYFPPGSIHVVVVDPGVGSSRRAIAVRVAGATFVAPDNGVLSWVLRDHGVEATEPGCWPLALARRAAPGAQAVAAIELTNPAFWRPEVSATFHGRDVFAPVAAHLSLGATVGDLGRPIDDLYLLPTPGLVRRGGTLVGQVIHVDHFGNLVTNLRPTDLAANQPVELEVRGQVVRGLRRYYAAGEGLAAVVGSAGLVEIALTGGSAAEALGARVGDGVVARQPDEQGARDEQRG